jgi:hypothetical protein
MRLSAFVFLALVASALSLAQSPARTPAGRPSRMSETIEIMHCLKARNLNWLGDSPPALEKAKRFHVGLRHDRKTYPGEDVVFVVVFENPTQGDVFELTREDHGRDRTYNLENNGSFRLGGKETRWPNEIFGGIWTHEYVEANIRKLTQSPKTWVQLNAVLKPLPEVTCSYYRSGNR